MSKDNLEKAIEILLKGGVVIFPTDTVWGIGCRFDNQEAVSRIYKIKGTPVTWPFPILVSNVSQVAALAEINEAAWKLMEKYWPGALTIILRRIKADIPGLSSYSAPGLGFRMPDLESLRFIIDKVGPIIGTSANFHGQPAPKRFEELEPKFTNLADLVLAGETKSGVESTVIDATVDPPKIIRYGAVVLHQFESM